MHTIVDDLYRLMALSSAFTFTRQKLSIAAKQRNEEQRARYVSDVSIYEPHMLVFVDETGADRRDTI